MISPLPNYYKILGVSQTCTTQDVKNAYRQHALKAHSDNNPDANTTRAFQAIREAFEVLNNPLERIKYDITMKFSSTEKASQENNAEPPKVKRKDRKLQKSIERAQARHYLRKDLITKTLSSREKAMARAMPDYTPDMEDTLTKVEKARKRREAKQRESIRTERVVERYSGRHAPGTQEWQQNQDLAEANQRIYKLQGEAATRRLQEQTRQTEARRQALDLDNLKRTLAMPGRSVSREQTALSENNESAADDQTPPAPAAPSQALLIQAQDQAVHLRIARLAEAQVLQGARGDYNSSNAALVAAHLREEAQRAHYRRGPCSRRRQQQLWRMDAEERRAAREAAARERWGQELERVGAGADAADRVRRGMRQRALLRFGGPLNGFASAEEAREWDDRGDMRGGWLTAGEVRRAFGRGWEEQGGRRSVEVCCWDAWLVKRAIMRQRWEEVEEAEREEPDEELYWFAPYCGLELEDGVPDFKVLG
ncbi:hypothetical protein F4809DRAFT_662666 [Biscogniauxia mediterranea]|nr:hypothetical protein F4809DRAFT_662666 [Biscogniauxia mediterranea]